MEKFSYSQLMTWDRCAFSWYVNYHEGWATAETKSFFIEGNIVHDLLMIYYKNLPLTDHTNAVSLVKKRVAQYVGEVGMDVEKLAFVKTASRMTKQYLEEFAIYEDQKWDILDAEKNFEIPLVTPKGRDWYLEGYIDILARERSSGKLYIWDHKTVGRGRFWTENQLLMDSQLPTYVAGLQHMGIPIFGAIVNQLNKHEYSKPADNVPENLFKRKPVHHTNIELHQRLQEVGYLVDELIDCREIGLFRRSIKKDCDGCFWMDPCLNKLKMPEAPLEDLMSISFKKKGDKRALI